MPIPTPQELGFPEKYDGWRPAQHEALRWMLGVQTRGVALCAPTGFGKTAVVVAYALITQTPTCIVTDNRGLQDQYADEYGGVGMVDIRGRRNYECHMRNDYTCEQGYAARCPHKGSVSCPSSLAEMKAAASPLVVTSYAKWTSARKYGLGMDHFKQVVFDEGHRAKDALAQAMEIQLGHKEVEEDLDLEFPERSQTDEFVNWKPWAVNARARVEEKLRDAKTNMLSYPEKPQFVRHYLHMRNLTKKLVTLATARPENWIADTFEDRHNAGYTFNPVRPARYGEGALLLRLPKIIVVSATLRPKALYQIGMSRESFTFREFASEFDPARCPIYYSPIMRIDSRSDDFSQVWVRHDQVVARRTDRKGITNTISFARQKEIIRASRFSSSMLMNQQGEATGSTVAQFKRSKPGTILVSPSVSEGYDFPGRECEFIILPKIPFPNGHTKIHKARQEDDKEYGASLAATKMEQAFGRGMRYAEDQCESFIFDQHLGDWFLRKFRHLLTDTFHRRFRSVAVLPGPPPRL